MLPALRGAGGKAGAASGPMWGPVRSPASTGGGPRWTAPAVAGPDQRPWRPRPGGGAGSGEGGCLRLEAAGRPPGVRGDTCTPHWEVGSLVPASARHLFVPTAGRGGHRGEPPSPKPTCTGHRGPGPQSLPLESGWAMAAPGRRDLACTWPSWPGREESQAGGARGWGWGVLDA